MSVAPRVDAAAQETPLAAEPTAPAPTLAPNRWGAALAPFRSRLFLAMWIASLASNFGSLIQNVGAAWLMTSLAHSADMVALVQVATVLPIMLFSLPAGAAADVWDRRRVMLAAQATMLVVSVALAALSRFDLVSPWLLVALTFLIGTGGALHGPAWQSSVREQVPKPDLPAAVALNSVAYNLARAAGPALGGVLVAVAGAGAAFALNAVSYFGIIAVLLTWRSPAGRVDLPPESWAGAMLAALRFARLSHALQAVLTRSAAFGFFASALWALTPLVARNLLGGGAITYGLLLAFFGAGAVLGALGGGPVRERLTNEWLVAAASAAFGFATLVAAASPWLLLTLPAMMLAGAAWLLVLSTFNVTVQLRSPRWIVGRALAIYQAGAFGGLALGAWLWGVAADRYGVSVALAAAALALVATALLGRLLPMPRTSGVDLEPVPFDAAAAPRLHHESGPVVTSIEYRVPVSNGPAFIAACRRLNRMRGRNGARRWALLHDVADPEVWVERFETPTWLDYLRLRHRMTVVDREVEGEVLALHAGEGEPAARHLVSHNPAANARPPGAPEPSVFDPSLPPALRVGR